MASARILVVEDENIIAKYIQNELKNLGYSVTAVISSGEEAIERAGETRPDLVLMDIVLKGNINGPEAAEQIRARFNIPVVYLTAYSDDNTLERAKMAEPFGYILKPFEEKELHVAVEIALYKHKVEQKLKESEERYRVVAETASDAIVAIDEESTILFVNKAAEKIFGYSLTEMIGQQITMLMPEPLRQVHRTSMERYISTSKRHIRWEGVELRGLHKSGKEIPLEISFGESIKGDRRIFIGIIRDITERKRAAEALQKAHDELEIKVQERTRELTKANEALQAEIIERKRAEKELSRLASFPEENPNPIIEIDLAGVIVYQNPAARAQFSTLSIFGLQHPILWNFKSVIVELEDKEKSVLVREIEFDKRIYEQHITSQINRIRIYMSNITERKHVEAELIKSKVAAEAASRVKSEFLANMSHEIRTPLNAIVGMAELLLETPLVPEQREYVRILKRAGDTLLSLINDILDLSKVEAGRLNFERVDFDLRELIERTVEFLAIRAHEKGLELNYHIAPDASTDLVGDPNRLRQILVNLIENAIKFTEEGEVTLWIENNCEPEKNGSLLFSVRDTGIGIPQNKLEFIFDNFTQIDSSVIRKYGGTGLGLSISKQLVELMGGQIWVKSKTRRGSTFYFTSRFEIQSGHKPRTTTHSGLEGLRILIADDNATSRLVLNEMLTGWGALVTEAKDGESGLAELKRAKESGTPYQILLLDRRMPGMDGFQIVERAKKDLEIGDITIMMLTSDNRQSDVKHCQKLGLLSYLIKPIKRHDLLSAITTAIGKTKLFSQESQFVSKFSSQRDRRALRILLVEDSEDNRLLIQSYLKKTTYQVDIAENGEVAIEKLKYRSYDLVLMDMNMPVMDGYTATQAIRRWEEDKGLKRTPIIALTAYALKEETQKSFDAGCTAHITKPIKKATLIEAIHEYVQAFDGCQKVG